MDGWEIERRVSDLVIEGDDDAAITLIQESVAHPEALGDSDSLPFLYEELAGCYSRRGLHDEAIAAMDKCIDTGYAGSPDGRALKAEFLLKAGRAEEAQRMFHEVKYDTPDDIWLYNTAALAYQQVDDHERALDWSAQGLELALADEDKENAMVQLLDIRVPSLQASGREPDDLDERALEFIRRRVDKLDQMTSEVRTRLLSTHVDVAMSWFPRDDYYRALEMWSSLASEWASVSHTDYCRDIQREMVRFRTLGAPLHWVAPIRIDAYLEWCEEQGLDPEDSKSRANHAALLAQAGEGIAWPRDATSSVGAAAPTSTNDAAAILGRAPSGPTQIHIGSWAARKRSAGSGTQI